MSVHDFPKTKPPTTHKDFPFKDEDMSYIDRWLAINGNTFVAQILGFLTQFTGQVGTAIATDESTTSTSPTGLTTAGPTITGLPDGKYMILIGADAKAPAADTAWMGVKVNSTEPTASVNDGFASEITAGFLPGLAVLSKSLAGGGNNTLLARYWTAGGGTGHWRNRRLACIRTGNT